MRVVDLFCGAGGFSEGFERAGFEIVRAYDIWGPAILTHNMNHGNGTEPAERGDIYEISLLNDEEFELAVPDSEIIIGSPPCIAFSNSNNSGKADKTEGIKLINAFLRIVARKMRKPNSVLKYWVMENVVNSMNFVQNSYTANELEYSDLGDFVLKVPHKNIYNMKYFGVPTNRKRFLCGNFPELINLNSEIDVIRLKSVLETLGQPKPETFYSSLRNIEDPIYHFVIPSSQLTDHHYLKEIPAFEWKKAKRQKEDKGYMGKMSFPENENKPARTIMATLSGSSRESMIFKLEGTKDRYRYPTIREVATLMSFPIDFRFYGESDTSKYRMIGNAVPPKFSYEIAKVIRKEIEIKNNIYIKDRFSLVKEFNDTDFTNLNGIIYPLKIEKPKKFDAKFNQHVPYLIRKSFRISLNNVVSDSKVTWKVKIHYSQGKNARVFENILVNKSIFSEIEINKMYNFVKGKIEHIQSSLKLQEVFRMTTEEKKGLIGPEELLLDVKKIAEDINDAEIFVEEIDKYISKQLMVAYCVLREITREINLYE